MKINEKNLMAFASSGREIDREGWLMKRGDGGRGFHRRWFVLKGNLLFYFEKKGDKEALGVVVMEGSTVELAESQLEEQFCFKISFPTKEYLLGAESHAVMEQWMKALACANYEYVKLVAAELQLQLDEITKESSKVGIQGSSGGSTPTPPPRLRSRQGPSRGPGGGRRPFLAMHEEFGTRILADCRERWIGERHMVAPNLHFPAPRGIKHLLIFKLA